MSTKLRAIAKQILPDWFASGPAKTAWEWFKRREDLARFRPSYPDAHYVYLTKPQINEIRNLGYHGQVCQDYFLDLLFQKEAGRFIDIGANNPVANSNTFAFEKKGWTGFAFDPMKSLKDRWSERAGTIFVNAGISDREEVRDFVEIIPKSGWEHQLSSFRQFVRDEDVRRYDFIEYQVECGPIAKFVPQGEIFDFVSIDVEGAEALILDGFDFTNAPPRAIMLENVSQIGGANDPREKLVSAGYKLVARLNASDDLFVHRDQELSPQLREAIARYAD